MFILDLKRMFCRGIFLALIVLTVAFLSCSDDKKIGLEQNLLSYNSGETVQFSVTGMAVCSVCEKDNAQINMMEISVNRVGYPLDRIGLKEYDDLGRFSIDGIRSAEGSQIEIHGKLYLQDMSVGYSAYSKVDVPDRDGKVVSITLKFPSYSNDMDSD